MADLPEQLGHTGSKALSPNWLIWSRLIQNWLPSEGHLSTSQMLQTLLFKRCSSARQN